MTECAHCGAPVKDDEIICPYCGKFTAGDVPKEGGNLSEKEIRSAPEEKLSAEYSPNAPAENEPVISEAKDEIISEGQNEKNVRFIGQDPCRR